MHMWVHVPEIVDETKIDVSALCRLQSPVQSPRAYPYGHGDHVIVNCYISPRAPAMSLKVSKVLDVKPKATDRDTPICSTVYHLKI